MEKVMVALRTEIADDAWVDRLCGPVAAVLQQLDLPGLTINVRDAPVRDSMMTLTTLDPPVQALVSLTFAAENWSYSIENQKRIIT